MRRMGGDLDGRKPAGLSRPACPPVRPAAPSSREELGGDRRPSGDDGSGADRQVWARPRSERYIVLQTIGSGTFGDVSMAIDKLTNRRVAIKQQSTDSETCSREFAFLAALSVHPHPNVAVMLDYFTSPGTSAKAVNLNTVHILADSTLWRIYRAIETTKVPITDARLAVYMRGVAAGLEHLHGLCIVHGDASLKNMLLMREDVVAVADFGAAHAAINTVLAADDEITTAYVRSPERILGESASLPSGDAWAFGVMMWCLRAGCCPWMAEVDKGKHLDAVAAIIGPVPEQSSLRLLPLWETHSMRIAQTTFLERRGDAHWPSEAMELFRAALCWEPTERASTTCIVRQDFLNISGGASMMQAVTVGTRSPSTTPRSQAAVATEAPPATDSASDARASQPTQEEGAEDDEVACVPTGRCQCRGNCGSRVHKKLANKLYRYERAGGGRDAVTAKAICEVVPEQGSRFCRRCKCERDGCKSARLATYEWRWCKKHTIATTPGKYSVPSGEHTFHKAWPLHVKVLARLGHLLTFVEPADCTALFRLARDHAVYKAGESVGIAGAYMFVAHLMKWPPAVYEFSRRLSHQVAGHPGSDCTGAELATMYQAMLEFSSGRRWSEMFDRMNGSTSLMDAATGLAVNASRMTLVTKVDDGDVQSTEHKTTGKKSCKPKKKASRRSRSHTASSSRTNALEAESGTEGTKTRVTLGRAQSVYEMMSDTGPAIEVFNVIVDAFHASQLRWPSSSDGLEEFADGLLQLVLKVRSFKSSCGRAWLQGGESPKYSYSAKHFVRMMLLLVEQHVPHAFDNMAFGTLSRWCPDQHEHAASMPKYTCSQIREFFGCSALMWHCWACLLGLGPPAAVTNAMKADIGPVWEVFLSYEASCTGAEDDFPPGPHVLVV